MADPAPDAALDPAALDVAAAAAPDSDAASLSKMAEDKFNAFQEFLFADFPSLGTLTTKNYEKIEIGKSKEEQEKSRSSRFEGYQKLCLFGLGSMFWGSVTGVLAEINKEKGNSGWPEFCFIYSDVALVLMLLGLAASTFPNSSWLAPSMSGLGSLQAFIFVVGAFHIGSLKYHSHINECLYSMITCTAVIIMYWGLSVQDPLILHILAKCVIWVIGITIYAACFILYCLYVSICKVGEFFSTSWKYAKPRGYEELPSSTRIPYV